MQIGICMEKRSLYEVEKKTGIAGLTLELAIPNQPTYLLHRAEVMIKKDVLSFSDSCQRETREGKESCACNSADLRVLRVWPSLRKMDEPEQTSGSAGSESALMLLTNTGGDAVFSSWQEDCFPTYQSGVNSTHRCYASRDMTTTLRGQDVMLYCGSSGWC